MAHRYFLGLDLGQAADYSALAILERQAEVRDGLPLFHCRHLHRWPLKTSYPNIVADVVQTVGLLSQPDKRSEYTDTSTRAQTGPNGWGRPVANMRLIHALIEHTAEQAARSILAVDATGVGAPVIDLFKREQMAAELKAIQITGGDRVTQEGGIIRVPKRDLVSAAQVALQTERLKVASSLPEASTLVRELQNFQVKINLETAHDSSGAWREGAHDDLVLAVALALWAASNERPVPTCTPDGVTQQSPYNFD